MVMAQKPKTRASEVQNFLEANILFVFEVSEAFEDGTYY